jgi:dihydrofolate synthase/folylpolyglutamate synthase
MDDTMSYLRSLGSSGIRLGLERIRELLRRMGDPQKRLKFVHVAGTNGKGSVAAMLAGALTHAGFRTGLYTSPYVLCFRETMRIDGRMIEEGELNDCAAYVRTFAEGMDSDPPTQFEVETAIAFEWFMRRRCDVVCLETGLGGRLDATNVIDPPIMQVITAVSLDHTNLLGDTVAKIAREKAGIIKGGVTVLCPVQPPEVFAEIRQRCEEVGSTLVVPDLSKLALSENGDPSRGFAYDGLALQTAMAGRFQAYNAVTAAEAVRRLNGLGFAITDADIACGVAHARLPARMEILRRSPLVLMDGGHNPAAAEALAGVLQTLDRRRTTLLMGILADKDYRTFLRTLAPYATRLLAVTPPGARALPAAKLAEAAEGLGLAAEAFGTYDEALTAAFAELEENDALVICGSLYLASRLRPLVKTRLRADGDTEATKSFMRM